MTTSSSPMPIEQALRMKTRASFTGSITDGKNARFLAICHDVVPCDPANLRRPGKPMAVAFTIVRPLSAGFTSVPYKQGVKQDGPTKKISELTVVRDEMGFRQPVMHMWSFKKTTNNKEKGARCDTVEWSLEAGSTILLWLREEDMAKAAAERAAGKLGKYSETIVPENMLQIDAFTLCEISIKSRNEDQARSGKGLAIASVRPAPFTLYSCIGDLAFLSPTLTDAREKQMGMLEKFPAINQELNVKDIPFWTTVRRDAVLDDSDAETMQLVRLTGPCADPSVPQVDILVETLLKYTNTTRVDWACALLDMAITAGALSLVVFSSEYWTKNGECGFRAIPLVNVEVLLSALVPTAAMEEKIQLRDGPLCAAFTNPEHTVTVDGVEYAVQVVFSLESEGVHTGPAPACTDFALTGKDTEIAVGFTIVFNLVPKHVGVYAIIPAVWRGYFNASPTNNSAVLKDLVSGSGTKRKRFQPMDGVDVGLMM